MASDSPIGRHGPKFQGQVLLWGLSADPAHSADHRLAARGCQETQASEDIPYLSLQT